MLSMLLSFWVLKKAAFGLLVVAFALLLAANRVARSRAITSPNHSNIKDALIGDSLFFCALVFLLWVVSGAGYTIFYVS